MCLKLYYKIAPLTEAAKGPLTQRMSTALLQPYVSRILASRFARAGSGLLSLGLGLRNLSTGEYAPGFTLKLSDVFIRLP